MKNIFRYLPAGDLPYTTDTAATRMIVKLFEHIPYLVNMPCVSPCENLVERTLANIPGIKIDGKKICLNDVDPKLKQQFVLMDVAFNTPTLANLEPYALDSFFLPKYFQIIERIKPERTVINLMGPLSIAQLLSNSTIKVLSDKFYRKLVIQAVSVKAMWIISKIKEISPETKIIIMLEEPLLYKAGDIKRLNDNITNENIVSIISRTISKIKEFDVLVGVQSFEKCDWKIPIDAGADIISFDAYKNPNNLNIIPDKVNEFLERGGIINWAIVPVMTESIVKTLSVEAIFTRLISTMESLISVGANESLIYNHATVSVQGNLDKLPLIHAEKALIMVPQLAKKIPFKN